MKEVDQRYLEFCKPFIDAVKEVYDTMLSTELNAGTPFFKEDSKPYGDVTALMGINGTVEKDGEKKPFKGNMILSWPMETYLKSASAMLMEEHAEMNEEIADVGMEISNITTGNAKKVLATMGYLIEMATPTQVNGKDYELRSAANIRTIHIPFDSKLGTFFIELNYEE